MKVFRWKERKRERKHFKNLLQVERVFPKSVTKVNLLKENEEINIILIWREDGFERGYLIEREKERVSLKTFQKERIALTPAEGTWVSQTENIFDFFLCMRRPSYTSKYSFKSNTFSNKMNER